MADVPAGMIEVFEPDFYGRMKADGRDIMPRSSREDTTWEVVASREVWGWSVPGWSNPGAERKYAVRISP